MRPLRFHPAAWYLFFFSCLAVDSHGQSAVFLHFVALCAHRLGLLFVTLPLWSILFSMLVLVSSPGLSPSPLTASALGHAVAIATI